MLKYLTLLALAGCSQEQYQPANYYTCIHKKTEQITVRQYDSNSILLIDGKNLCEKMTATVSDFYVNPHKESP